MSIFLLAAVAAATSPTAAPAPTVARPRYEARVTDSGLLCLRPYTQSEVDRLGIPLRQQQCRPMARWENDGLHIERVAAS